MRLSDLLVVSGHHLRVGGTILFACLPWLAYAEPGEYEQAYLFFAQLAPTTGFALDYRSIESRGPAKTKFHDPPEAIRESTVPWFSAGLRVWNEVWIGGDYLIAQGESEGSFGKRVRWGPLSFFVNIPTSEQYRFDIGRVWAGYRFLETENEYIMVKAGLTVVQAKAEASAPAWGKESAEGIYPMPMLGVSWQLSGPFLTRFLLGADYSQLDVNGIHGQAVNVALSVERPIVYGLSVGLGYLRHELKASANRPTYEGRFEHLSTGPYIFIRQTF